MVLAMVCGGVLLYSQTLSYYTDEGFDLLAAQLVAAGKRPYIDFFYQHTPLFTWVTAWWMRLFGRDWRSVHGLSALLTSASVLLSAAFVRLRIAHGEVRARAAGASAAALFIGLQYLVTQYATTAQAYGACLFLSVAAFRLAVVRSGRWRMTALGGAGFCAGAAAVSSFLALPLGAVLLAWLIWHERTARRGAVAAVFFTGALLSFTPLLWLLAIGPRQVLFDTVLYHLLDRGTAWPLSWDLVVLGSLADSAQNVLLLLLAGIGLKLETRAGDRLADELRLCAMIAGALAVFAAVTRPTFEQYFAIAIPFVAIPASIGAVRVVPMLMETRTQRTLTTLLIALPFLITPARLLHRLAGGDRETWPALELVAAHINRVTPAGGLVWTDQILYAAAQRVPPSGLETSVRLTLAPSEAQLMHVMSRADEDRWVRSGQFDTTCICDGPHRIEYLGLRTLYKQSVKLPYPGIYAPHTCEVFWDKVTH